MVDAPLHVLILAGGESTRLRTGGPKALLDLCGRPLLEHIFKATEELAPASRVLVLGPRHRQPIEGWLEKSGHADWQVVIQEVARGTGDAVSCALEVLPEEGHERSPSATLDINRPPDEAWEARRSPDLEEGELLSVQV